MSLTQLPVIPQAPGQPAFYPPDKIPKGAVIALMPVVILPQEYYSNCEENSINQLTNIDSFPLGVQPGVSFSLHSVLTGSAPKDQCMCPCSCTQNLPNRLHKKREATDAEAPLEEKASEPVAAASEEVKTLVEPVPAAAEEVKTLVEPVPAASEVSKAEVEPAAASEVSKVDVEPAAAASEEVKAAVEPKPVASEEVKAPAEPVPAASEEVKVKVEPEAEKVLADPKPETKVTSETN